VCVFFFSKFSFLCLSIFLSLCLLAQIVFFFLFFRLSGQKKKRKEKKRKEKKRKEKKRKDESAMRDEDIQHVKWGVLALVVGTVGPYFYRRYKNREPIISAPFAGRKKPLLDKENVRFCRELYRRLYYPMQSSDGVIWSLCGPWTPD